MTETNMGITIEQSGAFVETFTIEPKRPGILDGLSFAVKDLIDLAGYKTGCGNPHWRDTHPIAVANAVSVDQLLNAGARCAGKTVTDELAFSLNGENFFYGAPLNPRAPDRVTGGSSCGSASSVACGLVDFALGTDTGGSVRVPASNCGIFGMRPSYGVISVAGVNPLGPTFDTVGCFARDMDVLSRVGAVLLACEVPATVNVGTIHLLEDAFALCDPDEREALTSVVEPVRTAFPGTIKEMSLSDLGQAGASTELRKWYTTYSRVQWAEIWSCLGSWIEDTKPEFGPRTAVSFDHVRSFDRGEAIGAIRVREAYFRLLKRFLGPHDLICMPTAPSVAPLKGSLGIDRTLGDYYPRTLSLTAIAGIGRLPQITLPLADVNGVPIGLSLLAAQGMDAFLLAAAGMVVS